MELYIKTNGDPNYDPNKLQSDSRIATLLAQLDVILFTRRGEVLGEPGLGCNLEDLVYSLNYNDSQIKNEIELQLAKYVPLASQMGVTVDVEFDIASSDRDAIFININIDGGKEMVQVAI
jgi:hypothetical protein